MRAPFASKRHPRPSPSDHHPQPSPSEHHPQPSTSERHPRPPAPQHNPRPLASERHPRPSTPQHNPRPLASQRHPRRGPLVAAALALAILALVAPSALASFAHPTLPEIEPQAMCVTCKIPLNTAESPQASAERAFIKEQIAAGDNEKQVKNSLVAQYGPAVLSLPSTKGFDLAAYLVPIAVVLIVMAVFALLLPRWLRAAKQDRFTTAASGPLSDTDAERLNEDMRRFD